MRPEFTQNDRIDAEPTLPGLATSLRPHSTYNRCGRCCRYSRTSLTRSKLVADGGRVQTEGLDVDLEANQVALAAGVEPVFVDGELRLWEYGDGWEGYVIEDGSFYHVDTRRDSDDWRRKLRVGERAVRLAVAAHVADPDAGGLGRFERGVPA